MSFGRLHAVSFLTLAASALGCDAAIADGGVSNPLPIPGVFGDGGGGVGGFGTGGMASGTGGGSTTTTTGPGGGGQGACDGGGPVIESAGSNTKYLLKGTLLLPSGPMAGELLIVGNAIDCVGASCSADPQANGATVVQTNGVISPGLVDAHNHIAYDVFDEDDWTPPQLYTNHNQWPCSYPASPSCRYGAMGDAKRYLNGEDSSPIDLGCELVKYGEVKALVAGTTSVQGSPGNDACYGSVARSIDTTANDLPADLMRTSVAVPATTTADGVCQDFADGSTNAYVIHIAEGVDTTARNEFDTLGTVTTTDGCLYDEHTTIIHGVALDNTRIDTMAANGMSLVWSPKSNVFLYGSGTDLTKTANIPYYLQKGVNVALGPDWSIGGSQNMLDEMRFADVVDDAEFGDILTARDLWEMATINSAKALHVEQYLGSLEAGKRADVAVFLPAASGSADPYDAVLEATPTHVTMVFVDGRLLYGDVDLQGDGPPSSTCETFDACCRAKFLCIAETNGSPATRLDQTLDQIQTLLETNLEAYDDLNLSPWDFAPIAPVVRCQ